MALGFALGLGFCGSFLFDMKTEPGQRYGFTKLQGMLIRILRYQFFCVISGLYFVRALWYRMDGSDRVIIKKFDITGVVKSNVITIVGARSTGKSLIVKNILDQFPHIRSKVLFGYREYDNECDETITNNPEMDVYDSYSSSAVQSIVDDNIFLTESTRPSVDTLVIFNDCLDELTHKIRSELSCLMSLPNIVCVFVLQYVGFRERFILDGSDCTFMMVEHNLSQIKKRYETSKTRHMYSYEVFERIHQQITKDNAQDVLVVKGIEFFFYKTGRTDSTDSTNSTSSTSSVDTHNAADIKSAISMSSIEKSEMMGTISTSDLTESTESEMDPSEQSEFLRKILTGNRKQKIVDLGRHVSCTCDSSSSVSRDMLADFFEPSTFNAEPEQDVVIRIEHPGKRIKSVTFNIEYN